jgi:site-specific recombinase XerD
MVGTNTARTLMDALRTFETVGMPARNFAVRTRREYSRDLRELLDYLAMCGITDVEIVRLPHLEGYLAKLDRCGLQGSSRNRKTHTIKSFFKWLVHHDLLITNPSIHLIPP